MLLVLVWPNEPLLPWLSSGDADGRPFSPLKLEMRKKFFNFWGKWLLPLEALVEAGIVEREWSLWWEVGSCEVCGRARRGHREVWRLLGVESICLS